MPLLPGPYLGEAACMLSHMAAIDAKHRRSQTFEAMEAILFLLPHITFGPLNETCEATDGIIPSDTDHQLQAPCRPQSHCNHFISCHLDPPRSLVRIPCAPMPQVSFCRQIFDQYLKLTEPISSGRA